VFLRKSNRNSDFPSKNDGGGLREKEEGKHETTRKEKGARRKVKKETGRRHGTGKVIESRYCYSLDGKENGKLHRSGKESRESGKDYCLGSMVKSPYPEVQSQKRKKKRD